MPQLNTPAERTTVYLDGTVVYKGQTLAQAIAERNEHELWCGQYGSPSYGGWRTDSVDGRHKPVEVIEALGRLAQ